MEVWRLLAIMCFPGSNLFHPGSVGLWHELARILRAERVRSPNPDHTSADVILALSQIFALARGIGQCWTQIRG
jgi:hypothetical protein